MSRDEFMAELRQRLSQLSAAEAEKTLSFYREAIADRVEDGMSEEEAVAALGGLDEIVRAAELEQPLAALVKSSVRRSRERAGSRTLWLVLAICGSPIWLSVGAALASALFAVYVSVWAAVASLYAAVLAFAAAGVGGAAMGVFRLATGSCPAGLMLLGMAIVSAGLAALCFKPMNRLAGWLIRLTALLLRWIKGLFTSKKGDK